MPGDTWDDIRPLVTDYVDRLEITDTELALLVLKAKFDEGLGITRMGKEWILQYLYQYLADSDRTRLLTILTEVYDRRIR